MLIVPPVHVLARITSPGSFSQRFFPASKHDGGRSRLLGWALAMAGQARLRGAWREMSARSGTLGMALAPTLFGVVISDLSRPISDV